MADGEAQSSFWTASVKMRGAGAAAGGTYRCESCGYLESYARYEHVHGGTHRKGSWAAGFDRVLE
jgi:hypothetical protein